MGDDPKKLHVGFPEVVLESKASVLVEAGFKIAIVEQTETPEQLKERVKKDNSKDACVSRELCNVFTGKKDVNQASNFGKYHFWSCAPSPLWSDEKIYEGEAVLVAGNGSYTGRTTFVNANLSIAQVGVRSSCIVHRHIARICC